MKPLVYLAGAISTLSYGDSVNWRETVKTVLDDVGIVALSPMRAKQYLRDETYLVPDCEPYGGLSALSTNRGITSRDRFDATRCDLLFVNLLGTKSVSIGTVCELAWADLKRTPIVCAIEPDGSNPHEHGMLKEMINFRVPTLAEAIDITKAILLP